MKFTWREKLPIVTFINGFIYFVASAIAGGSAWHGKVSGGKFYVGSYGEFYEVAKGFYYYSLWHGVIVIINILILIIALSLTNGSRR